MIEVEREPKDIEEAFGRIVERCIFCGTGTRYWYAEHYPVCQDCAMTRTVEEIPPGSVD